MKTLSVLAGLLCLGAAHTAAGQTSLTARSLANEIWDDIKNAVTCDACQVSFCTTLTADTNEIDILIYHG